MTSDDIDPEKLEELKTRVAADLRYYSKLVARLQEMGIGPNDHMMREAEGARAKLQDLHVAIHYASCRHGVGKDARPDEGESR